MSEAGPSGGGKQGGDLWVVYLGLLLAGLMMLAEAANYRPGMKLSARLAAALIYTAVSLFITNGKPIGYVGVGIVWVAVLVTALI